MKFWITLLTFATASGLSIALLALLGLPYQPLSSLSGRNPYIEERQVVGNALLQARELNNNSGTEVTILTGGVEVATVVTDSDGSFSFILVPGTYDISSGQSGWLRREEPLIVEDADEPLEIGSLVHDAGDADADEDVDTNDLVRFQESLDQLPPPDSFTDPKDDGVYDIFDMAFGGLNFRKTGS